MGKKILYIVLGTLLVFGLLFLLWLWLFSGSSGPATGTLGSAGNVNQPLGEGANTGNGETSLNGGTGGTIGAGSYNAQGIYVGQGNGTYDASGNYVGTVNTTSGTGTGGAAGAGSYNAQGVYVGQGNGTYDANGNYVGTVGTAGGTGGTGTGSIGAGGTGTGGGTGGTIGAGGYNAQGVYVGAGNGTYDANGNYVGTISSGATSTGSFSTTTGGFGSTATGTLGIGSTGTTSFGTTTGGGGATTTSGATWFGTPFYPTGINSVITSASGTAPAINTVTFNGIGPSPLNLGSPIFALIGVAAGVVSCGIRAVALAGAASTAVTAVTAVTLANTFSVPVRNIGLDPVVAGTLTAQTALQTGSQTTSLAGCVLNAIGKVVLQMITQSVVNWINGGFKGQPSFISNYQQFFTNTADIAAGQFIQGGALSFLCSPFQLQIKIAIAQSYAKRNNIASCSLTKAIGNINNFMNGNFSQGGWPGFVSFTTVPTNNPYGSFAYAQVGLASAQSNALANAKNNISPTGFLNLQQQTCPTGTSGNISAGVGQNTVSINTASGNVTTTSGGLLASNSQAGQAGCQPGCQCKVATPGNLIEGSLQSVVKSPIDQLGIANDLDQIINALVQQLTTSVLYHGLNSLSQSTTQTAADTAAQTQAVNLLNDTQAKSTAAQQLGAIYQGSIADIQGAQPGLNSLANCWGFVASTTSDTTAAQNAADANAALQSLGAQVDNYNNLITQVNGAISTLNQFESDVTSASSGSDITSITSSYNAAVSAGAFPSAADLTTAQQNRTTLQSQLATTNQSTQNGLVQCRAAGGQ